MNLLGLYIGTVKLYQRVYLMQNKDMKKAVIKTLLESSPLKNKPNFIDNFIKSKMQLKGKNVIKKIGVPKK